MNSNMITNNKVCKKNNQFYLLLFYHQKLLAEYLSHLAVFMTFVGIVFVTFVNTLSVTFAILLHTITDSSAIPFRYLLFSQICVLGFRLKSFLHLQ